VGLASSSSAERYSYGQRMEGALDGVQRRHRGRLRRAHGCGFGQRDVDATMATMTDEPHVYHVPVVTGGGFEEVRRFYGEHFIGKWPHDTKITPVSRTVGEHQVVEEIVALFTHDIEMDAVLPGVPPTGRKVRLLVCMVVTFEAVGWRTSTSTGTMRRCWCR
jgi:hypothetical protein